MSKKVIFSFLTILFALASFPLRAEEVQWGRVEAGKLESDLRVPGHVIPQEGALSVESARVPGRITDILKREGDTVKTGDPLFAVSSAECISLAEELRVAQSRNLTDLVAASEQREKQLGLFVSGDNCQILATHPGTLIKRQIDLGASFNVGDSLATILDLGNLTVELEVPELDLASLRLGQRVTLEFASSSQKTPISKIAHILPTIDPVTRTTKVRVNPVSLPAGTTLDAFVMGTIEVRDRTPVLRVPAEAVVFKNDQHYVVKKKGSEPVIVEVQVLSASETEDSIRPVQEGLLQAGDSVAVRGALFLFDQPDQG